jgi:dUTPase
MSPNGYALIKDNNVYGIYIDSDLGQEYAKLTTKEEKRKFLISKGERIGDIILDTRRRAPDVVYGASASESK